MPRPIMAGLKAVQDSVMCLDRAVNSLSNFLNSSPTGPDAFVEGTKDFFCSTYDAVKVFVPRLLGTHPVSGNTTSELADLESGVNVPELPSISHEPGNNPFVDAEDSENVRQSTMGEEQGRMEALSFHSYHALMWMAVRFVGPLSLIVVPGLVLGVVTGQLPWGIALCGAIATVLSFFVGLKK